MRDIPALELVPAADTWADEPNLDHVLTPPGARDREGIWKHPPIRGIRAINTRRE
jgi:hypothetical protein